MRLLYALPTALALAGCAAVAPPSADDGPPPDFRAILLANKSNLYKDPESIRDASISTFKPAMFGWRACMRANAKNSFGGYTGLKTVSVLVYKNGSAPLAQEPTIYDGCGSEAYEPFHEIEGNYVPPAAPALPVPAKPPGKPKTGKDLNGRNLNKTNSP